VKRFEAGSGSGKGSLDPVGNVYALFGCHGLDVQTMPVPDTSVGDGVGYHIRSGSHDILEADWKHHLDFADRLLKKR